MTITKIEYLLAIIQLGIIANTSMTNPNEKLKTVQYTLKELAIYHMDTF